MGSNRKGEGLSRKERGENLRLIMAEVNLRACARNYAESVDTEEEDADFGRLAEAAREFVRREKVL